MAESPGGTDNPAAYDLYLRGYDINYATSPAEAAALYRQAVALDPEFGQAWAELAWVYWSAIGVDEAQKAVGTASYEETASKIKEFLKEAEKHPSSNYYELMAELLVWQRNSDDAILAAERAIALDPSDVAAYQQMSQALSYNGRAADAKAYLDAASRVDPQPRPYRYLLSGLVAFSLARFDDAITSLDRADPQEFHADVKSQRLFLLAAAHAHLGHTAEAASAKAELEALAKERGRGMTGLRAINVLPFKQRDAIERLWVGLRKAGVPEFPFGYQSKDQLAGEEVRSLVFGHELRGRQIDTSEPYMRSTALDGAAKMSIGSWSPSGVSQIVGDFLCTLWSMDTNCVAIFRNPGGTRERQNEYVLVADQARLEFSVVK
jgi:tetratricopeptide (TPR) repeat protein